MAVMEELMKSNPDHPSKQRVADCAAAQAVLHAIRQSRAAAGILEFVAMNPAGERSFDLFVDKERVFLIAGVHCGPGKQGGSNDHTRSSPYTAGSRYDPHGREGRSQHRERILPLVKAEDYVDGRINDRAFDENRHV